MHHRQFTLLKYKMAHIVKFFTAPDRVKGLIFMQRLNPMKSYNLIDITFTTSVGKTSAVDINICYTVF